MKTARTNPSSPTGQREMRGTNPAIGPTSEPAPMRPDFPIRAGPFRIEPYFDDRVHFPDVRIEYELAGHERHEDLEVVTEHYRGRHATNRVRAGTKQNPQRDFG